MAENSQKSANWREKILHLFREDDPDIGALVPGAPPVVAEHRFDPESRRLEASGHLTNGQRAERQLEAMFGHPPPCALDVPLFECREAAAPVLANRLDQRQVGPARRPPAQLDAVPVLAPVGYVRNEIDGE